MAIDWNHWLKLYKPLNEEIILLTLELNPDDIKIDHFMGERYIVNKKNLLGELNLEYDRRMRLLKESRFRPFAYLENLNDGGWGNYFSADGSGTQVITNRFLLWLNNEEIGWDLPKELTTYIEKLDKPNEPQWAQELVDNLNNKLTQPKVTQKWKLKPGKVYPGYRLALFEFLKKEYDDGMECPPNAYDFIAKLNEGIANGIEPENIWVKRYGIEYKIKSGTRVDIGLIVFFGGLEQSFKIDFLQGSDRQRTANKRRLQEIGLRPSKV